MKLYLAQHGDSVPEAVDAAWSDWYNGEYIPGYRTVPGVIYARRYRVLEGEVRYTTVYEFESEAVPESAAWDHQREHSNHLCDSGGKDRRIQQMLD